MTTLRIIKAGIIYFLLVFGAGFVLGPVRVLLLVPLVGEVTAELIESPIMFVVIFFAARWTVRRNLQTGSTVQRLCIGLIALVFLISFEVVLTPCLWGVSFTDYIAGRDPTANVALGVMLIVFALMPIVVARRTALDKE